MSAQLNFWSGKNYLKRDVSTGQADVAAPATSQASGAFYNTVYTVEHNLGYIPLFFVSYEPFNDGVVWPPLGLRAIGAGNPLIDYTVQVGPTLVASPSETTLSIELSYLDNSLTGTYPVYWVIYKDYGIS